MYLTYNDHYWAVDVETDDLNATKIWVACAVNIHTKEEKTFTDPDSFKKWWATEKAAGGKLIFHNGIGFDYRVLNELWRVGILLSDVIDTLVMSMLYSPSLEGGHSLDEWGHRLRIFKGHFNDWSHLSDEMISYCLQDCRVTRNVFLELVKRMTRCEFTESSIQLEMHAWAHVKQQQRDGFAFNLPEAHQLLSFLRNRQDEIRDRILGYWPPELLPVNDYARPYKKDGQPSKNFLKHSEEYERVEVYDSGERYRVYAFVAFNIGSPAQRTERLLALGWEPREFTETGQPKATVKGKLSPSLEEFVSESGKEEVRLIAQWIEVNARANMINTWIESIGEDGRIHGSLWLANTLRYRHSNPNTANIPAVRVGKSDTGEEIPLRGESGVWTYDARDLWTCRPVGDRRLVGVDAKGIQLRVLAHYLNNTAFTENILSKDPHAANQKSFGLPSRSLTKTITYAILMGAGDARVSNEARIPLKEARGTKAKFFEQVPELPRLISRLQVEAAKTGRIKLCDGSSVIMKQDYMVIPYLLQGDESKIMKVAMLRIAKVCRQLKIDAIQAGMIHDELQFDVLASQVPEFIKICLEAFEYAGRYFKYNIQIEGDAKVGRTWAETH